MRGKRSLVLILSLVMLWTSLVPAAPGWGETGDPGDGFMFIHVTDTHVGSNAGNKHIGPMVQDIMGFYPSAAFVVNGGDVSELGMANQYQEYQAAMQGLSMPVYNTLGNHESRWADAGKATFNSYFGAPYSSFDYKGIHFVVLDSTVNGQQQGHLERTQLDWLAQDLARAGKETPVIIFTHYSIGYQVTRFMDNDWEFFRVVEPYNIRAVFTGHGHTNLDWKVNGISFFMTQAAMEGGYKVMEVDHNEIRVHSRVFDTQEVWQVGSAIPLQEKGPKPGLKITKPGNQSRVDRDFTLQARLDNLPEGTVVEYRLEGNGWKPLPSLGGGLYGKEISEAELDGGLRTFWVRATDDQGAFWMDRVQIWVDKGSIPGVKWSFTAGGGIQGAPVVYNNLLYVGANDGKVYALNTANGRKVWEFASGGPVASSPVIYNGKVYFGSADKKVYALNAATGAKVWEYATAGAIVASPLVQEGTVYIGSGDRHLYALDAATGKQRWKFATGNMIAARPAGGEGKVFFGSWDQTFYAVDAKTGQLAWSIPMGTQIYYAPAVSSPLYAGGRVFVTTPGSRVCALAADTGEILWEVEEASGLSNPQIFNYTVVLNTLNGGMYALDPETGEKLWGIDTNLATYGASPVAHGGDLVLATLGGKLVSVNTGNEPENWRYQLGDNYLMAGAASAGNVIYAVTMEGKVYALNAPAGPQPKPFPGYAAFSDIVTHWARKDINRLAKYSLIKGYEDGGFHPDARITRAEWASLLARYLGLTAPGDQFKSKLTDLKSHWAASAVQALEEKQLVSGYQEKKGYTFRPDQQITRAEAAVLLARVAGLEAPTKGYKSSLKDISRHWAKDLIMALEEKGLVAGSVEKDQVVFKPDAPLTRAEAGVLILRLQDNKVVEDNKVAEEK